MNKTRHKPSRLLRHALTITAAAGTLLIGGLAYADDTVTMAPPVQTDTDQATADAPDNTSEDTVFNWQEIPANQDVQITRAVFDQSGYQLYDNVGETIVVPFTNDNLYVMKFGLSDDGSTYFVNNGTEPILYVPQDGYLENATVAGAKWYPFPDDFHPARPVFLGVAPSWDAYVGMDWYPDMVFHGGYYADQPFFAGVDLFPTVGLFFEIGGHHYDGWHDYVNYTNSHPGFFHVGHYHPDFYAWADRSHWSGRTFGGDHSFGGDRDFGNRPVFQGDGSRYDGAHHHFGGGQSVFGAGRGFSGGPGSRPFTNGTPFSGGGRSFGGGFSSGSRAFGNGGHSSGGGHSFFGGNGRTGSGGSHGQRADGSSDHGQAQSGNNAGNHGH